MRTRQISILLLLAMLASSAASCGGADTPADTADSGTTTTAAAEGYSFPKHDGYEFNVLNVEDIFSMHGVIDPGETNGDTLNDSQYNTVRKLEEKTSITFLETNVDLQNEFFDTYQSFILAGEDTYDIVYMNQRDYWAFASEGYMVNLLDVDGFNFDEAWWLKNFNDNVVFNDSMYMAQGYAQLMVVDAIAVMLFNKDMMDTHNLDTPYQAVKDGTWTLDMLQSYLKAASNLNGDEAYTWKDDGACIWGITMPSNAGANWLFWLGEKMYEYEGNQLVLTVGSERFYDVCTKLASLMGMTDGAVYYGTYSGDDAAGSYVNCFEAERAMFGMSQIAKTGRLRDANFTYGVLPYPKCDENQESYCSSQSYPAAGVTIPITCENAVRSAEIADALNYLYYENVWPDYREVVLDQKNLRDEESMEMLDIVLEAAVPNYATIFSISSSFNTEVSKKLRAGDDSIASTFASYKEQLQTALDEINNQ